MKQMLRVRKYLLLWALALTVSVACSQPTPTREVIPEPEAEPNETEKTSPTAAEGPRVRHACDAGSQLGDYWGLFPLEIGIEACPPSSGEKLEDMQEELSAFDVAAMRVREEEQARKAGRAPASEIERANAKPWESLPPARVSRSADHCIGYCFDALLGAVDGKNSRLAQVVVFDRRGRPTRAFVERTRVHDWGPEVRYVCFDRVMDGGVPRFTDCMQTGRDARAPTASKGAAEDANDWADDPLGDGPFPGL